MKIVNRQSQIANEGWLPDMDLNHDKQIQSLLCYRYTIGQRWTIKLPVGIMKSRFVEELMRLRVAAEARAMAPLSASTLPTVNALTL